MIQLRSDGLSRTMGASIGIGARLSSTSLRTNAPGRPPPAGKLVGQILDGTYRVDRLIAVGGMSQVYEAEHLGLRRKVAIKVVLDDLVGATDVVARFVREIEIVAALDHPHIVQVIDAGNEGGVPFLVLEYLRGETLDSRLRRERWLPVVDVVALATQIASALAEMHAQGVVHRDLKPANLFLVRATGAPVFAKVLDFGVSRTARADERRLTGAQALVGTPQYMAPEQVFGRSNEPRVDQFALASILYEVLTGTAPFDGATIADVLRSVVEHAPPPPSHVAPWVPASLDPVIMRGLAKEPGERYATVVDLAAELEQAFASAAVRVRPAVSAPPTPLASGSASRASDGSDPPRYTPAPMRTPTSRRGNSAANATATALVLLAQRLYRDGDVDGAVEVAERLLEQAAYERDAATLAVLGRAIPSLDKIFRARVGSDADLLAPGRSIASIQSSTLSWRATAILDVVCEPMSVGEILRRVELPERDGIRLLAGLLRRGALELVSRRSRA